MAVVSERQEGRGYWWYSLQSLLRKRVKHFTHFNICAHFEHMYAMFLIIKFNVSFTLRSKTYLMLLRGVLKVVANFLKMSLHGVCWCSKTSLSPLAVMLSQVGLFSTIVPRLLPCCVCTFSFSSGYFQLCANNQIFQEWLYVANCCCGGSQWQSAHLPYDFGWAVFIKF